MLAKQALWQVHTKPSKKIKQPNYKVTRPSEQNKFGLVYLAQNVFERIT